MLRRHIEDLGLDRPHRTAPQRDRAGRRRRGRRMRSSDGGVLDADLVVFSAGVRPRDELARAAGLAVGERGGVVVDDALPHRRPARLRDRRVRRDRRPGATAWSRPATRWPRWSPTGCSAATADVPRRRHCPPSSSCSASTWPASATRTARGRARRRLHRPGHRRLHQAGALRRRADAARRRPGRRRRAYADAAGRSSAGRCPAPPLALLAPAGAARRRPTLPGARAGLLLQRRHQGRRSRARSPSRAAPTSPAVKACTRAGTSCGSCVPLLKQLLAEAGRGAVQGAVRALRPTAAQELFDIVRVRGIRTFSAARRRARHAAAAATSASRRSPRSSPRSATGYILDGEQAALQDTNDHFLANLQRNGTYSVVPRIPGGEITPEKLIVIGEVARDFGLYTKITGGQRIDLFGARVEQLPRDLAPAGRRRLRVRARLRQGAAHGEVLRRVDLVPLRRAGLGRAGHRRWSCATAGLRAPHKLKSAVSGCARECAEARSKDFGIIATENGWNLYVGGNGGFRPAPRRPARSPTCPPRTLVRVIDRFLMFYIRTADRLQRTAAWLEAHGRRPRPPARGHRRRLARASARELDAAMAAPRRRPTPTSGGPRSTTRSGCARFVSFVNAPGHPRPDDHLRAERGPARAASGAGALEVRDATVTHDARWTAVCPYDRLRARARRRRAGRRRRRSRSSAPTTATLHAIGNRRPVQPAPQVLSRGIVGTRGDAPTVASPMHKQVFDLRTGRVPGRCRACACRSTRCGVRDGMVEVGVDRDRRRGTPEPPTPTEAAAGRLHRRRSPPTGAATSWPRCWSGAAPGSCSRRRCGSCPLADDTELRAATAALRRRAAGRSWSPPPASGCAAGWRRPRAGAWPRRCARALGDGLPDRPRAQGARRDPGRRADRRVVAGRRRAATRCWRTCCGAGRRRASGSPCSCTASRSRSSPPRCATAGAEVDRGAGLPLGAAGRPGAAAPAGRPDRSAGWSTRSPSPRAPAVGALLRAAGPDARRRAGGAAHRRAGRLRRPGHRGAAARAGRRRWSRPAGPGSARWSARSSTSCPSARPPLQVAGHDGDPARPRRGRRRRAPAAGARRRWRCCGRWPRRPAGCCPGPQLLRALPRRRRRARGGDGVARLRAALGGRLRADRRQARLPAARRLALAWTWRSWLPGPGLRSHGYCR